MSADPITGGVLKRLKGHNGSIGCIRFVAGRGRDNYRISESPVPPSFQSSRVPALKRK